jgi:hypothetical protein
VREVRAVCDQRGIVRRHWWGTAYPETLQPPWAYVKPRP